ncbi:MAG: hypothetical protein HZB16_06465 [Armatimonadetes bacterium]|nr:hypothetical protein [Armatimonadota bacterium]
MNSPHEPQRFPDRGGWLRNRRAVVLDDDGLTVEWWLGAPTRIAWGNVLAARWERSNVLLLKTVDRPLRLRNCAGGLAEGIQQKMRPKAHDGGREAVAPADIERWLGDFREAYVGGSPSDDVSESADTGCASWATGCGMFVAIFGLAALAWIAVHGDTPPRRFDPGGDVFNRYYMSGSTLAVFGSMLLYGWWRARRVGFARPCLVSVDPHTIRVGCGAVPSVVFGWTQVAYMVRRVGYVEIGLHNGEPVRIPPYAEFAPFFRVLRLVLRVRDERDVEVRPVPDTALSPVHGRAAVPGGDRGISKATANSRRRRGKRRR